MKKLLLLVVVLTSTTFFAQEKPNVEFNSKSELYVNGQLVNNQSTYTKIVELLGKPELIKEHKSGKKTYFYSQTGIAFSTFNDKLSMLGFNYNWDGDKNFPNTTFTGKLTIGKIILDAKTSQDFMKSNDFLTFEPAIMDSYFAVTSNGVIMVGFKNEKITQIGFEFKKE